MKILSIMIVVIAMLTIHWLQTSYTDAMEKCQQNHSYDTCAYALR